MAISENQRDDNADTRQKNQPDSVISNGVWYKPLPPPFWAWLQAPIFVLLSGVYGDAQFQLSQAQGRLSLP